MWSTQVEKLDIEITAMWLSQGKLSGITLFLGTGACY